MLNKLKLSTKMSLGFGLVLVLLAAVGYTGASGLGLVMTNIRLADLGQSAVEAIDACALYRRDFSTYGFGQYGKDNKTAIENWQTTYEQLHTSLQLLADSADLPTQHRERIATLLAAADNYRQAFSQLTEGFKKKDQGFATWRVIATRVTAQVIAAREVLDKSTSSVEAQRDVASLTRWFTIARGLDADVVEPFLMLRVKAMYAIQFGSDERWADYETQLRMMKEGLARWSSQVRGENSLESILREITAALQEYDGGGQVYHNGLLAERQAAENMEVIAASMLSSTRGLGASLRQDMKQTSDRASQLMLIFGIGGLLAGVLMSLLVTRSIVRPLSRVIESLGNGAEQTASAAGEVSAASQSLAQGSSEQSATVEEVSSALEEMASMTRQNAGNAQHASALMNDTRDRVAKGQESMGRLRQAIGDIKKSSDETSRIVKTIDEIAFQTDILALNAAVEAARAGDAGRGFSVVAEEVRNLAQRSAEAARNTAQLIDSSVRDSERGVSVAAETSEALTAIIEASEKVRGLVGEIAAASQEQARGIDEMNTGVGQLNNTIQQNAASAEESASAAEELNSQAAQLRAMIVELQALIGVSATDLTSTLATLPSSQGSHFLHTLAHTLPSGVQRRARIGRLVKPGGGTAVTGKNDKPAPSAMPRPEETIPLDDDDEAELAKF